MDKRLVSHDRGDGVQLTGKLYLPPGYEPERHGRLPLVLWAYPLDYGDAGTAGQVRGSTAAVHPAASALRRLVRAARLRRAGRRHDAGRSAIRRR